MALARSMLRIIIGFIFLLMLALHESGMAAPMLTLTGSNYYFYYEF
jgi:hypothetical protein